MKEALKTLTPWVVFAGCVLVVAVLYWTQAVLVPVALSVLLTFFLTPLVMPLQRRIGRVPAVLLVVVVAFTLLGLAGWGLTRQAMSLIDELPGYRDTIRQKIADIRVVGKGGSVEKLQKTVEDIKSEIEKGEATRGTEAEPVVVKSEQVATLWGFPTTLGPLLEPLATVGLVIVMVIFMLLERQDLRNRLISVLGHGRLTVTTKAFDEAATRISRYLLMQSLTNLTFGAGIGLGLYLIGVPYPLLWASLAAALRFIPYVGPWIAASAPIAVSLAALEGWVRPVLVISLFVVLELFTNLVLETYLYAGAAGVSQVGLLIAVAFWTWLWGPLGLLMATPLTVCLVVLGKHVPALEFLATLMSDAPELDADVTYYQRLLAGDSAEAADLIERRVKTEPPETVYDAIMLPALNYAERDRAEGRLSPEEERSVVESTRELLDDAAGLIRAWMPREDSLPGEPDAAPAVRIPVLGYAAHADADELALQMFRHLIEAIPFSLELASARVLSSEIIAVVKERGYQVVCIADLPPSPPSKARYLVKRLRAAMPDLKILVGRWAPPSFADERPDGLLEAGADHVGTTLLESREHLQQLRQVLPRETLETTGAGLASPP